MTSRLSAQKMLSVDMGRYLTSVYRHEPKCVYGSSQWSVLRPTRSYGARLGLATYLVASRRAGCRQIPGQP